MSDDLTPVWYVIYRTADGRVMSGGQMPRAYLQAYPAAGIPDGQAMLEVGRQPDLVAGEWVSEGELITPAALSPAITATTLAADGAETVTISDLPSPCWVTITHSAPQITPPAPNTEVTDGVVEVRTVLPGRITVRIDAAGHLTWRGTFDAV